MLSHFLRRKNTLRLVRVKRIRLREIIRTGFPAAFNDLALGVLAILFNRQIMRWLGTDALAVYGIVTLIATIVQCVSYGIGQAAQPILSENHGAGRRDRVGECLRCGIWTSLIFGFAVTAAVFAAPEGLVRLFTAPTREVLAIAPKIVRAYGLSLAFLPFNIFGTYYFRAVMNERVAAVASVARGLVISGGLVTALPLAFGADSIFYAMPAAELIVGAYLLLSMRKADREKRDGACAGADLNEGGRS